MSDEREKCHEHTLDCNCKTVITINPPKGYIFGSCQLCNLPFCYDGSSDNCLFCEINKDEDER